MKTTLRITDSAEKAQLRLAARLLSKRELATVLNICQHTIEKWLAQDRIFNCGYFRIRQDGSIWEPKLTS